MITKRVWASVLMATMVLGFCACGKQKGEVTPAPGAEPTATATPTAEPTIAPLAEKDIVAIYQETLKCLLEEHIELDGYKYEDEEWESLGQIEFAVCDVDVDGEQELIIRHADTYMAGQYTAVYRYDAERGELVSEGGGTASCRFYSNGTMQDDLSHNQGYSRHFWPFIVYEYDSGTKGYEKINLVDAWELEYMKEAGLEEEYPAEADKEGAGFVYYFWEDKTTKMSQTEYDAWYDGIFGGAKEIEVNYQPLTAANVGNLYYEGKVKPKVYVNILNEWLDYSMYDRNGDGELKYRGLSQRQNKLMNDLPVDELPRKAAGGEMTHWTREEIWEDTLLPLCYDEKNDFTLYAVVAEGGIPDFEDGGYLSGAGILARQGEDTEYYPIVHEQFWTGSNPLMVVKDFNGDGSDEAAVALLTGRGTGVSLYVLYIFDLSGGRLYREETVDFSGIDIDVAYDADTKTATLTSGDSMVSVELDFPEDWEFTGVYAGNIVNYRYEDGKLLCELGLDFSGRTVGYLVKATGEVVYQNGKYTLGPLKLEAY